MEIHQHKTDADIPDLSYLFAEPLDTLTTSAPPPRTDGQERNAGVPPEPLPPITIEPNAVQLTSDPDALGPADLPPCDHILQATSQKVQHPNQKPDKSTNPTDWLEYLANADGLWCFVHSGENIERARLSNFTAKITTEEWRSDGLETQLYYVIKGEVNGRKATTTVPAKRFESLVWVTDMFGADAIIYPMSKAKQLIAVAVKTLSKAHTRKYTFLHTGWLEFEGRWVFLHGNGAIGPDGPVAGLGVELHDSLSRISLPNPPRDKELATAVAAVLRRIDLGPDMLSVPLMAAPFAAVLGGIDYGLHVAGGSGVFKTAVSALAQQHFGAEMSARHLPASWTDTANALEVIAFLAKDVLVVVDDFVAGGAPFEAGQHHSKADRLFRGLGNNCGRQRMGSDGKLRQTMRPRGLPLSTGEEVPHGHSLQSRMLILEVAPGDVPADLLTVCQKNASDGLYAQAMASYIQWLAPQYEEAQRQFKAEVERLHALATKTVRFAHGRTPGMVSHLDASLSLFLRFAQERAGLPASQAEALRIRAWSALCAIGARQAAYIRSQEPATLFLDLLNSAIVSGAAHLATVKGCCPDENPEAWGWTRGKGTPSGGKMQFSPKGKLIGWIRGDDVYLEPTASYKAAQAMDSSHSLTIDASELLRRLRDKGILASVDSNREVLTVRVTVQGKRTKVVHLKVSCFNVSPTRGEPDRPDQVSDAESNLLASKTLKPATEIVPMVIPPTNDPTSGSVGPRANRDCVDYAETWS